VPRGKTKKKHTYSEQARSPGPPWGRIHMLPCPRYGCPQSRGPCGASRGSLEEVGVRHRSHSCQPGCPPATVHSSKKGKNKQGLKHSIHCLPPRKELRYARLTVIHCLSHLPKENTLALRLPHQLVSSEWMGVCVFFALTLCARRGCVTGARGGTERVAGHACGSFLALQA
jgi:hypothetical protein